MNARKIMIENGDRMVPFFIYKCKECGSNIPEDHGYAEIDNESYCYKCAFICGKISEEEYLKNAGYWAPDPKHIRIINGIIEIWPGEKRSPRVADRRRTSEYKSWRTGVFERDKFTCQECGTVGGRLEAHHIMPYSSHKDLRLDTDNGKTLCVDCHKKAHGKN